jgi:pimeloyl-ACP methyl ester carboxylesterase
MGSAMSRTVLPGPAGSLRVDDGGLSRGDWPIVFVHSMAGNVEQWSAQLVHVRATHRAVALDLRGHGRSDPPADGDYSLTGMAADIGTVVEELDLERIVLVGHSMGGGVALTYAGANPQMVAGLLLLDPIGDGKQFPASQTEPLLQALNANYETTITEYWKGIAGPNGAVRQRLLDDLRATPQETVVASFREALRFDPDPSLARYRGPILAVVTPFNDQPFSLHRLGAGFPHRVVQGTGHWIQLEKPEEFNRILNEFLEKSVSGTRTNVSGERYDR